jgi:hypothetical protein
MNEWQSVVVAMRWLERLTGVRVPAEIKFATGNTFERRRARFVALGAFLGEVAKVIEKVQVQPEPTPTKRKRKVEDDSTGVLSN